MNARTAAALALGVVIFGYLIAVRPLEARIAERYAQLASARAAIDGDAARAARSATSERDGRRLRVTLARYALGEEPVSLLRRFLDASNAAATLHGTSIRALDAEPAPTGRTAAGERLFDELSLRLTLRGSYGALLATLRTLSTAPVACRIALEALAPDDRRNGDPVLVAVVHVVLLHLPRAAHAGAEPY
jgi:hypothetical protein